jgi:hypothetical protein
MEFQNAASRSSGVCALPAEINLPIFDGGRRAPLLAISSG